MLRIVPRKAVRANSASWRIDRKTIAPTAVNTGVCHGPREQAAAGGEHSGHTRSGWWKLWIAMPCTTALISSLAVYAAAAGMTPATAVVTNSPRVVAGLASQTNRSTLGRAEEVPVTDCFRLCQRPRRSFGPSGSGGASCVGSPVRPLLACPVSGFLRRPPHQWIIGGPAPGGII